VGGRVSAHGQRWEQEIARWERPSAASRRDGGVGEGGRGLQDLGWDVGRKVGRCIRVSREETPSDSVFF